MRPGAASMSVWTSSSCTSQISWPLSKDDIFADGIITTSTFAASMYFVNSSVVLPVNFRPHHLTTSATSPASSNVALMPSSVKILHQ